MRKGIVVFIIGFVIFLCSMGAWSVDNSNFAFTGIIGLFGLLISMMGLLVVIVEMEKVEHG